VVDSPPAGGYPNFFLDDASSSAVPKQARFSDPLETAIRAGDKTAVAAAIEDDPLAICRPLRESQQPPLIAALESRASTDILALLLQEGADPNETGRGKVTALEVVVRSAIAEEAADDAADFGYWPPSFVDAVPPPPVDVNFLLGLNSDNSSMSPAGLYLPASVSALPSFGGGSAARTIGIESRPWAGAMLPPTVILSEDECFQRVWLLLQYGARASPRDAASATLANLAERGNLPRVAELIRNWSGEQVRILKKLILPLLRRVGAPGGGTAAARHRQGHERMSFRTETDNTNQGRKSSLLDVPDVVQDRILDMLAPALVRSQTFPGDG